MSAARWTWTLTQSVDVDADIRDEIEAHLDAAAADRIAAGMDPEQAQREALARFGDVERIVGACRTVKLEERIMLQRALLALVAILSIAVVVQAYQLNASQARTNEALAEVRHDFAAAADRIETALLFVEIPYNSPAASEHTEEQPVDPDPFFLGSQSDPRPAGDDWDPSLRPAERLEAVHALAKLGDHAVPALLRASGDRDLFVRLAAVRALGGLADTRAVQVLAQISKLDSQEVVRAAAMNALAKYAEEVSEPPPVEEEGHPDPFFLGNHTWESKPLQWDPGLSAADRFEAVHDLYALGDPAVGPLIEAAGDSDVFVRLSAVRFLGELAHDDAKAVLVELSKLDPQEIVREEAKEALQRYDD